MESPSGGERHSNHSRYNISRYAFEASLVESVEVTDSCNYRFNKERSKHSRTWLNVILYWKQYSEC